MITSLTQDSDSAAILFSLDDGKSTLHLPTLQVVFVQKKQTVTRRPLPKLKVYEPHYK